MSRMPLDASQIKRRSDVVLLTGPLVSPEQSAASITTYQQYAARDPDVDRMLYRGEVVPAPVLLFQIERTQLIREVIGRCDAVGTCDILNYDTFSHATPERFRTIVNGLLDCGEPLQDKTERTLRELLAQSFHPEFFNVSAAVDITQLPEFSDATGIMRLTDLLLQAGEMPRPTGPLQERYFDDRLARNDTLDINDAPQRVQDLIKGSITNRIERMATALKGECDRMYRTDLDAIMTRSSFGDDISLFAEMLPDDELQRRVERLVNGANDLLTRGGNPDTLDFIANGIEQITLINSSEIGFFNPGADKRVCIGFSDFEYGIYLASNIPLPQQIDALLEEAAHSSIRNIYGNQARPYLAEGDAIRETLLRRAVALDLADDTKRYKFDSTTFYDREILITKEIPAKMLKFLSQGPDHWTEQDERAYPHLAAFVRDVMLPDYTHFLAHNQVRSQEQLHSYLTRQGYDLSRIGTSEIQDQALANDPFPGLQSGISLSGSHLILPATGEYSGGLPQTPPVAKGIRSALPADDTPSSGAQNLLRRSPASEKRQL